MKAVDWLAAFFEALQSSRAPIGKCIEQLRGGDWTHHMEKVMQKIGKRFGRPIVCRNKRQDERSGEYLGIDFVFLDPNDEDPGREWPKYLPVACAEHENAPNHKKIGFCLWKLLSVRSPLRILICYQPTKHEASELHEYLEHVIWRGGLMHGETGELLVLVGNEEIKTGTWQDYYAAYEWRSDALLNVRNDIK